MRHILVTGSDGFIGRAVEREMTAAGWVVHPYGHDVAAGQDVRHQDFRSTLEELARHSDMSVLHLAAEVGKLNCERFASKAIDVNVYGTLNVARACTEFDVPLTYCSTSEVYGDHGGEIVDEDSESMAPPDVYGFTKYWGEQVCESYAPEGLKIVRPVMAYGPGVPPGFSRRAMDNFIWWALTGQPIVVHRGSARTWCWIDDIASAIRTVIEKGEPGIYNVGRDDDEVEMEELAWRIALMINDQTLRLSQLGSGGPMIDAKQIQIIDPPARQTAVKRISCAKLRALGWEPKTSLDEGLPIMVAWIKSWMDNQNKPEQPFITKRARHEAETRANHHMPYPGCCDAHS